MSNAGNDATFPGFKGVEYTTRTLSMHGLYKDIDFFIPVKNMNG